MRYVVVPITFDKNHSIHPEKQVFFVKDLDTNIMSMSYYMTYETAKKIVEKKNSV